MSFSTESTLGYVIGTCAHRRLGEGEFGELDDMLLSYPLPEVRMDVVTVEGFYSGDLKWAGDNDAKILCSLDRLARYYLRRTGTQGSRPQSEGGCQRPSIRS